MIDVIYKAKPVGERITTVVNESGLKLDEASELVGVNKYTLKKWMNGEHYPGGHELTLFCRAFHVSADYILGIERAAH